METTKFELEKIKKDYNVCFDLQISYFDDFVNDLIDGKIENLAPPFNDYYTNTSDIISFYYNFNENYLNWVNSQDMKLIKEVNKHMHYLVSTLHPELEKKRFNILEEVTKICGLIEEVMNQYFAGYSGEAYNILRKGLTDNDCHLLLLLPQLYRNNPLYRVRKGAGLKERKELFHTPFELRGKCDTYRFSIPGYPSLYLAGSLKTSLLETEINDNDYSCCAFRRKNSCFRFIDLTLPERPNSFVFDQKYGFIVFYPLIVACSLAVKNKNNPFKPEYILPQLFYQVIHAVGEGFDGICYASTKQSTLDLKTGANKNYALFVNGANQEFGYSEKLANNLECTKPISPRKNENFSSVLKRCNESEFGDILLS